MNSTIRTYDNASAVNGALLAAPYRLNICLGTFLWTMGNIGCLGNMIIFRSREFRKRAYSIYLFWASLSDLFYLNFVLVTRIIQKGYRIPVIDTYIVICKLRRFQTIWGNLVSFSLYVFATLDRLLSTERSNSERNDAHSMVEHLSRSFAWEMDKERCLHVVDLFSLALEYRQWSNRGPLAHRMVIACALLWFLLTGHRLIFYQIRAGRCAPLDSFYSYYDTYFQVIFSSVSPAVVMVILAFLLIRNVRAMARRRVAPTSDTPSIGTPPPLL